MKTRFLHRRHGGFTLIEAMIALVILAVGILGGSALTQLMAVKSTTNAWQKTIALELARSQAKAFETYTWPNVRSVPNPFVDTSSSCAAPSEGNDLTNRIITTMEMNNTTFYRIWQVSGSGSTERSVRVVVYWKTKGKAGTNEEDTDKCDSVEVNTIITCNMGDYATRGDTTLDADGCPTS
ncbi:MAG: hypothetical protein GMKNLPBB_00429 [Myxococcota bacterium]|nr:hypothetical protein [Myxococcota bacterium]